MGHLLLPDGTRYGKLVFVEKDILQCFERFSHEMTFIEVY
jgi:hypothetical protein